MSELSRTWRLNWGRVSLYLPGRVVIGGIVIGVETEGVAEGVVVEVGVAEGVGVEEVTVGVVTVWVVIVVAVVGVDTIDGAIYVLGLAGIFTTVGIDPCKLGVLTAVTTGALTASAFINVKVATDYPLLS